MCTVFVPNWCCQINQSLYVHSICSKLVLSDKPVPLWPPCLLCPLTTLVLSDKPVTVCAPYLLSSHNVSAVKRICLCTARVLFFTTGWTAGGHWWTTRVAKDVYDQGNQHNNGPHQDQILDKPSALCLTMLATNQIRFGVGLIDSPNRLFMNGTGLFFFPSTINYFFFWTLRPKTVWINLSSKHETKKKRRKKIVVKQLHGFLSVFCFYFSQRSPVV